MSCDEKSKLYVMEYTTHITYTLKDERPGDLALNIQRSLEEATKKLRKPYNISVNTTVKILED